MQEARSPGTQGMRPWCWCLFWATPPVRLGLSRRNSGKIPERLRKHSQSVPWNSRREYGWGAPNPIIKGIWGFQSISRIISPPSAAGGASFFRSGSGEGLSETVMEFPILSFSIMRNNFQNSFGLSQARMRKVENNRRSLTPPIFNHPSRAFYRKGRGKGQQNRAPSLLEPRLEFWGGGGGRPFRASIRASIRGSISP